jgi:hypothetical protein
MNRYGYKGDEMKNTVCGLLGFSALLVMASQAEMHAFEAKDGRAIEAEIVDYDARSGKVTLKRADGKRIPVKADFFVAADQAYIREWDSQKAFSSDRLLKISFDEETVNKSKEEVYRMLTDTEGNKEEYLMKEIKYEDVAYEVELRNMNKAALDGMRMEYRIYYEQSRENRDKQNPDQFILAGKSDISAIAGGQSAKIVTQPVTIYDDNLNAISWSDASERVPGRGDVHGVRARIYMKTKSGKELMREACYPDNLSTGDFGWKDGTGKPPAPADSKKK